MYADDMNLLREFATSGSEPAFATLVQRHVNLVYSAALRRLGNGSEAEEVAQAVFIILAQKAARLRPETILSGWLYQTAQLTAANYQRVARRRQRHEQEAYMQFTEQSQPDLSATRLGPLLEEAMARLNARDRDAIVLRFFENRSVREVAAALGLQEDAAQKRVNRATGKLRDYFLRRGIRVSAAALSASMGNQAVQAAPVGLAKTISVIAVAKGATASTATLTLSKGVLKIMAWTKVKTTAVGIIVAVGVLTATTVVVQHYRAPRYQSWAMNELGNAGYATPEAALKTVLWSMFQGDLNSYIASSTDREIANLSADKRGRTREQVFALATDSLTNVTSVQILDRQNKAPDAVILLVHLEGEAKARLLGFKKVGGAWKFDQMIGVRLLPANPQQ